MAKRFILPLVLVMMVMGVAACGSTGGSGSSNATTVNVTLSDMKIVSSLTTFEVNKPYRFVVKNSGAVTHEWYVMNRTDTDVSKALFGIAPDKLPPGATQTVEYTFKTASEALEMACHLPGHYEAGMHTNISVK